MGWGEKAIEIRSVETGHLDGVFMHKRAQRLKFLCERNDKVRQGLSEGAQTQWWAASLTLLWPGSWGCGVGLLFCQSYALLPLGSVAFTPGTW